MLSVVAANQANRSIWLFNSGERVQRLTGWAFHRLRGRRDVAADQDVGWRAARGPFPGFLQGAVSALTGHLLVAVGAVVASLVAR